MMNWRMIVVLLVLLSIVSYYVVRLRQPSASPVQPAMPTPLLITGPCVTKEGTPLDPLWCKFPRAPPKLAMPHLEWRDWSGQLEHVCWHVGPLANCQTATARARGLKPVPMQGGPSTIALRGEEHTEWLFILRALADAAPSAPFVFFEIGAGFGRWAVRAALLAQMHRPDLVFRAVCIEAVPVSYELLRENIKLNEVEHLIEPVHAAVWTTNRTLFVQAASHQGGTRWWGQAVDTTPGLGKSAVSAFTLDTLLAAYAVIDAVDVDIQGAEGLVRAHKEIRIASPPNQ